MKKINIAILGAVVFSMTSLTGCLDETFPQSSTATDEQVAQSPAATANMAAGLPASTLKVWDTSRHYSFGLPAVMIVRDFMTGDRYHSGEIDYSKFWAWEENKYQGDGYIFPQFIWNYYYGNLLSVNQLVGAINPEIATDEQLTYLGNAYAYRAMLYLDLARMFEFLPNDIYAAENEQGVDVRYLTVPIVTDETTPEQASNNPRATHDDMAEFILKDLKNAEKYLDGSNNQVKEQSNIQPDIACVYGLMARLYLWNASYYAEIGEETKSKEAFANASEYAQKSINTTSVQPITKADALNTATGFNTASQFMWAMQQTSSNVCVQTGIINWTSMVSNQTTFGYTGLGTGMYVVIDKNLYDRIPDTDWRKLEFVAPEGSPLEGQTQFPVTQAGSFEDNPAYSSAKFRPGNGDTDDFNVGAATAIPLMRVEEMYFIWAEAEVQQGNELPAQFVEFMKSRDPEFTPATEFPVDQIITNKRIELWGEGQAFFDIKRLNMSVTRGYAGTNCQDDKARFNTNGRPAWMNLVMVKTESNNNHALEGMNNPDPSDKYVAWSEEN